MSEAPGRDGLGLCAVSRQSAAVQGVISSSRFLLMIEADPRLGAQGLLRLASAAEWGEPPEESTGQRAGHGCAEPGVSGVLLIAPNRHSRIEAMMSRSAQRSFFTGRARASAVAGAVSDAQEPPAPVRAAFTLWVVAVAAGVFETVLAVGRLVAEGSGSTAEIAVGLAVRLPVFTAALLVTLRMRRGYGWARIVLTLGLGVVGTASMVIAPIHALAHGRTPGVVLREAGAMDLVFGASRVVHVTAVLSAVVLMFLPTTNRYFKLVSAGRASGGNGRTVSPRVRIRRSHI